MSTQAKRLAFPLLLLSLAAGSSASAGKITCVPGASTSATSPFNWVRRISIDEHSRTVNMDIVRSRTKDTETMGKLRADLVSMEENQSGEPVYIFNSIPKAGVEATSLFKLFKAAEWRLMSANVIFVNKVPVLQTVEQSVAFDCKRSDMG
jgi:hypothetical protein